MVAAMVLIKIKMKEEEEGGRTEKEGGGTDWRRRRRAIELFCGLHKIPYFNVPRISIPVSHLFLPSFFHRLQNTTPEIEIPKAKKKQIRQMAPQPLKF